MILNSGSVQDKKVLLKNVIRALAIIAIVCVFIPFGTVSCYGETGNIGVMTVMQGVQGELGEIAKPHMEAALLIIIPIIILIINLLKIQKEKGTSILTIALGGCEIGGWLYMTNSIKNLCKTYNCGYENKGIFIIDLLLMAGIMIAGALELIGAKDFQSEPVHIRNASRKCPVCGTELGPDILFCPKCGNKYQEVEERICPYCGAVVPENTEFCGRCGKKYGESTVVTWTYDDTQTQQDATKSIHDKTNVREPVYPEAIAAETPKIEKTVSQAVKLCPYCGNDLTDEMIDADLCFTCLKKLSTEENVSEDLESTKQIETVPSAETKAPSSETSVNQVKTTTPSVEKCPKCGEPRIEGAKFCPSCGADYSLKRIRICRNCGAELMEGKDFCIRCGTNNTVNSTPVSVEKKNYEANLLSTNQSYKQEANRKETGSSTKIIVFFLFALLALAGFGIYLNNQDSSASNISESDSIEFVNDFFNEGADFRSINIGDSLDDVKRKEVLELALSGETEDGMQYLSYYAEGNNELNGVFNYYFENDLCVAAEYMYLDSDYDALRKRYENYLKILTMKYGSVQEVTNNEFDRNTYWHRDDYSIGCGIYTNDSANELAYTYWFGIVN